MADGYATRRVGAGAYSHSGHGRERTGERALEPPLLPDMPASALAIDGQSRGSSVSPSLQHASAAASSGVGNADNIVVSIHDNGVQDEVEEVEDEEEEEREEDNDCMSGLPRRAGISLLLLGLSYAVAIAVPSITVVFRVLGSTGACYLFFIYPTGVFLLLDARHRWRMARSRRGGRASTGEERDPEHLLGAPRPSTGGAAAEASTELWPEGRQIGQSPLLGDERSSHAGSLDEDGDRIDVSRMRRRVVAVDGESLQSDAVLGMWYNGCSDSMERAAAWFTLVCGLVIGVSSTWQVFKDLS